jgi:nucleoside-diphosphate-sugar epimerase
MSRVLVTGARGFLGHGCVQQLMALGLDVHATTSSPRTVTDPGGGGDQTEPAWHQVDLRDPEAAAAIVATVQPERILHLAWVTDPGSYWHSPDNLRWVEGSLALARAAALHGVTRFVGAGSCAEYDWDFPVDGMGGARLRPHTLYGTAKHALNTLLERFARHSEFSLGWGRIFFLYGPRERGRRLIPYVIRSILRGEPAECSSGEQIRDFLYVDDASAAFTALLLADTEGAFDVGTGAGLPLSELVQRVGALLGRPDLVRLGARDSAGEPPILVADTRRLRGEVGWSPEVGVADGLQRTIDWWLARVDTLSNNRN